MYWMLWLIPLVLIAAAASFVVIARKGRALRKNQPLPPPAERAYLRWNRDGSSTETEVFTPFYLGKSPDCQIVAAAARAAYEVCIFYHHSRFAFQSLPGSMPVLVNGEERPAGYLWDGDLICIAGQEYRFLCY